VLRLVSARRNLITSTRLGLPCTDKIEASYGKLAAFAAERQFQAARRSHKLYVQGGEGSHISLKRAYCLAADIDGAQEKVFLCMSNIWSLLAVARQINSGWPVIWHGDVTFNFCKADASFISIGVNSLGGHYNNVAWSIMCSGRESGQSYRVTYDVVRTAIHLVLKIPECAMADCITCRAIRDTRGQLKMKRFMASDVALAKGLPGAGLTADGGKGINELCEILRIDRFKCSNHLTGTQQFPVMMFAAH